MSRQTRVQAPPPPPPYSWPATAVTSEPTLTPDVAASYGIAPSMQTMGTSTPPGYWSSSGSPPLMPVKDFRRQIEDKCTAAIRMMAYGTPADELDDYLKIGESTALKCLKHFAKGVIANFAGHYLRRPTCEDVERLLQVGESRGFPGMLGSLDCMHWQWENCPVAWKGQFTCGDHGVPTLMLEAVASYDLWIWHAFFGVAGSNNDINVLNQSPLFIEELKGEAPRVQYTVNERRYNTGYYLVDGIYPEWAAFVKTIPLPQTEKDKRFAQLQEGARKDIERAFGVLQSRFSIVRRPARLWSRASIGNIMKACIILHNMIVEDEREMVTTPLDLNETPGSSVVLPPEMKVGGNTCFADVLRRNAGIRDRSTHTQLKRDLVEHIWKRFGN
ncbi:uncharacterized protein LOC123408239 [Hordeum vulgare subsp. vulgare]|uniref:uncharacterized protein LOC123408239 n=1 Tax=Hordeum vulgare subsp. vulgare TaxID=112509 RepID=UPI001D1A54D4|nr:uncharacterized protein LOC123408239 [Hordeum vulgare subsp. vulgare]